MLLQSDDFDCAGDRFPGSLVKFWQLSL